jgi:hypothetical protein
MHEACGAPFLLNVNNTILIQFMRCRKCPVRLDPTFESVVRTTHEPLCSIKRWLTSMCSHHGAQYSKLWHYCVSNILQVTHWGRTKMCLQLIPGFSLTIKTTSRSQVPSNEASNSFYARAKTPKSTENDEDVEKHTFLEDRGLSWQMRQWGSIKRPCVAGGGIDEHHRVG